MKKSLLFCSILLLSVLPVLSAGDYTLSVSALNGPTGIGMIHLFDKNPDLGTGVKAQYSVAMAPKVLMGDLIKKSIDIAVLPVNMPALLYARSPGYKVAAIVGMGNLYIVSRDPSIRNLSDLKGKTLFNGAKGATPDFLSRYLFSRSGIDMNKDLYVDFSYGLPDLAKAVIGGLVDTAILPEPFITMIREKCDASIVVDMQDLWKKVQNSSESYPLSVLVIRDEILEKYPDAIDRFLEAYQQSIAKVNSDPAGSARLVPAYGFTMDAATTEKAIPRLNLKFIKGEAARDILDGFYQVLYTVEPKTIGGAVPGGDLYYIEK